MFVVPNKPMFGGKKAMNTITENNTFVKMKNYRMLYLLVLPAVLSCLVFSYKPMTGVIMAFQDFDVVKGISGSPFVGLQHFKEFLSDPYFYEALKNTLGINGFAILIGFPLPLILALGLFSLRDSLFKKINQTISYLPHFISWVVVGGLVYRITDESSGVINHLITQFGHDPIPFLREPHYFWWIALIVGIWKELGWISIIYLAALAGVDQEQYEAAMIDGANGFQKLIYITLPSIMPTISIVFIFTIATLINTSGYFVLVPFDAIFNLRNPLISSTANTLDFYIYQTGVLTSNYSYSTAIGLVQSLIALFMVLGGNKLSKKIQGYGAF
jgi:putative aldouronate transport system permease protein